MNKPHIPQPCHEDWNAMTQKEKGRHCDVCAKVVIDFTKMNDAEVIDYLQQHAQQKTCGHFRNDQLNQPEKLEINLSEIPANLSFRKYFAIALLLAFTSFGLVSCKNHKEQLVGIVANLDTTYYNQNDTLNSDLIDGEVSLDSNYIKKLKCTEKTKGKVVVENEKEEEKQPYVLTGAVAPLINISTDSLKK